MGMNPQPPETEQEKFYRTQNENLQRMQRVQVESYRDFKWFLAAVFLGIPGIYMWLLVITSVPMWLGRILLFLTVVGPIAYFVNRKYNK